MTESEEMTVWRAHGGSRPRGGRSRTRRLAGSRCGYRPKVTVILPLTSIEPLVTMSPTLPLTSTPSSTETDLSVRPLLAGGVSAPVKLWIKDGPVLNLRLPKAGALEAANPDVAASLGGPGQPEPKAVILPSDQAKLKP